MIRWTLATAAVLLVAAQAAPVAGQDRISIGYLVASSAAPIKVIQERDLARKHGFEMDAKEFVDLGAMDRSFVLGEYDVHSSLSMNTFGEYLNRGTDLVMILGSLYPHTAIIVPKNSPYRTLADLKGKRFGTYGIHGTSTAVLGVIAQELAGLDIRKDMKLFGSTPPALPTLLAKGEVDAILVQPPFGPRMVASGQYRILATTAEEWQQITGSKLPFAGIMASRKTIEAKRPAIKKLVAAWREAVDYIRQNPEALNAYLASAKITDPAAQKIAHEIMLPHYMNSFAEKDVENIRTYWSRAVKYGFMQKPVESQAWYTFEFAR
jgi:NitT/TauT family transport system substrate-binding protein